MKSPITALVILGRVAAGPRGRKHDASPGVSNEACALSKPFTHWRVIHPLPSPSQVIPSRGGGGDRRRLSDLKPPAIEDLTRRCDSSMTKDTGPFMVTARVSRGPDAERMALALAKELRNDFGLSAYILRKKDSPSKHGPSHSSQRARRSDGSERQVPRTVADTRRSHCIGRDTKKVARGPGKLLARGTKLEPRCLEAMPALWWRKGSSSAMQRPIRMCRLTNSFAVTATIGKACPQSLRPPKNRSKRSRNTMRNDELRRLG